MWLTEFIKGVLVFTLFVLACAFPVLLIAAWSDLKMYRHRLARRKAKRNP